MIYLNNFFNLKKRIVNACFLLIIFSLFFIVLSFCWQAQARSKTLNLVIGKYECTKNEDCSGEDAYCDINQHICKTPQKACDPDLCTYEDIQDKCPVYECFKKTDCKANEFCDTLSHTCQPQSPDCKYIINEECAECISDDECNGKKCDMSTHICSDFDSCDPRSGKILVNGKCACKGNMSEDKYGNCVCLNVPEGGDEQTCDCPLVDNEEQDVVQQGDKYVCMPSCPTTIPGITGMRNAQGECLCDTSKHFKSVARMYNGALECECEGDTSADDGYYKQPNGYCQRCRRYTNAADADEHTTAVDETVWSCSYYKTTTACSGASFEWPQYYNPSSYYNSSIPKFCEILQVLRRNSAGEFVCEYCDDAIQKTGKGASGYAGTCNRTYLINRYEEYNARTNAWGICACLNHSTYDEGKKMCKNPCIGGYKHPNGRCAPCYLDAIWNGSTCHTVATNPTSLCWNGKALGSDNSGAYSDYQWYSKAKEKGCPFEEYPWPTLVDNPEEILANSTNPTEIKKAKCSYKWGCSILTVNLPACAVGKKVTNDCKCSANKSLAVGELCCSVSQIRQNGACVECPGGSVPDSNQTACVDCEVWQYSKDGQCLDCPTGSYPSSSRIRCLPCLKGKTTSADKLSCVCPEGTKENVLTGECV